MGPLSALHNAGTSRGGPRPGSGGCALHGSRHGSGNSIHRQDLCHCGRASAPLSDAVRDTIRALLPDLCGNRGIPHRTGRDWESRPLHDDTPKDSSGRSLLHQTNYRAVGAAPRRKRRETQPHEHAPLCREACGSNRMTTDIARADSKVRRATREMFYNEALGDALRLEMERDERVIVIGEDIAEHGGAFQVTVGLLDKFGPTRIRQTPISEIGIVGAAVGAALTGLRPVVELMYVDFAGLAMDQIVNQAAQNRFMFGGQARVPMVLRTQGGSGRGNAAQHSKSLEAWFAHVAGLKLVMPSTPADAKGLLTAAIRDENPVIFLEHKLLYRTKGQVPEGEHVVPLGKADIKRAGTDLTIVTWSREMLFSLEAAAKLAADGISAEVVDVRTLVPLDRETILGSVRKTHRLLVVHEAIKRGCYGAEIAAIVAEEEFDDLDAPPKRLAGLETPIPYARHLELSVVPQVDDIIRTAKELVA